MDLVAERDHVRDDEDADNDRQYDGESLDAVGASNERILTEGTQHPPSTPAGDGHLSPALFRGCYGHVSHADTGFP